MQNDRDERQVTDGQLKFRTDKAMLRQESDLLAKNMQTGGA